MSEQEEFQKWWIRFVVNKLHHQCTSDEHLIAEQAWKACAERKDKVIEQQAADLAALRVYAEDYLCDLKNDKTYRSEAKEMRHQNYIADLEKLIR